MHAYGMNRRLTIAREHGVEDRADASDAGRHIQPAAKARVRRAQKRAARRAGRQEAKGHDLDGEGRSEQLGERSETDGEA